MDIPHGFTPESVGQALSIWEDAVENGRLVPKDAYDIVTVVSSAIASGETVPGTLGEFFVAGKILELTGVSTSDHK